MSLGPRPTHVEAGGVEVHVTERLPGAIRARRRPQKAERMEGAMMDVGVAVEVDDIMRDFAGTSEVLNEDSSSLDKLRLGPRRCTLHLLVMHHRQHRHVTAVCQRPTRSNEIEVVFPGFRMTDNWRVTRGSAKEAVTRTRCFVCVYVRTSCILHSLASHERKRHSGIMADFFGLNAEILKRATA